MATEANPSMRLKSYFSNTVEAALELARKEMGEEALLVNARPATLETRHLGAYEVVFGIPPRALSAPAEEVPDPEPAKRGSGGELRRIDRFSDDLAELRRQIERMNLALRDPRRPALPAPASELAEQLELAEVDAGLIAQVNAGTPLEQLFRTDATLGKPDSPQAIVMLAGPPGAGKTSTLIKLAARYGLATARRTHILTSDVHRIAAADQLRTLAGILGIGCDVVETPLALAQALEEHQNKDLVLIDTPGLGPHDLRDGEDWARLAAQDQDMEVHLVAPASMRPADLRRTLDGFAMFAPAKLIFTRLDETTCYGTLLNEAAHRDLPLSFLCGGQNIPDDLEPATRRKVIELLLGRSASSPGSTPRSMGAAA